MLLKKLISTWNEHEHVACWNLLGTNYKHVPTTLFTLQSAWKLWPISTNWNPFVSCSNDLSIIPNSQVYLLLNHSATYFASAILQIFDLWQKCLSKMINWCLTKIGIRDIRVKLGKDSISTLSLVGHTQGEILKKNCKKVH